MNEVVMGILVWIAVNIPGYEAAALISPPPVRIVSQQVLCEKASLEAAIKKEEIEKCLTYGLLGGYHEGDRAIYFPEGTDVLGPMFRDRLAHEVFHEVQRHYGHYDKWRSGDMNFCSGRIEFEAYRVQMRWRLHHGISPARIISPFQENALKACTYTF